MICDGGQEARDHSSGRTVVIAIPHMLSCSWQERPGQHVQLATKWPRDSNCRAICLPLRISTMYRCDQEESILCDAIGYVRKRGDESPSPTRPIVRPPNSKQSLHHSAYNGNTPFADTHARNGQHERRDDPSSSPSISKPVPTNDGADEEPRGRNPTRARTSNVTLNTVQNGKAKPLQGGLEVRLPSDEADLTINEFVRYQHRYGTLHKTAAKQGIKDTADEEALDPTLGNRRSRKKIDADGSIDCRDFGIAGYVLCHEAAQTTDEIPEKEMTDAPTSGPKARSYVHE